MTDVSIAWNRFGLGGKAGDTPPANARKWLIDQLDQFDPAPAEIAARPRTADAIAAYHAYRADRRATRQQARGANPGMDAADMSADMEEPAARERQRAVRRGFRDSYREDIAARGFASTQSSAPFAERLVHFWSNHFAVSAANRQIIGLVGPYEFDAIRPNIMGTFSDLLRASVLHPAMLLYLDQAQSAGPGSRYGIRSRERNRVRGLNENLAREIMELHTLGVRSGYSQEDITEFARAMTGWTVAGGRRARRGREYPGGAAFAGELHEPGNRTIMGQVFRRDDARQALDVLDMLAAHPATARHIATKLTRHFAGDEPPPAMIARLEEAFLSSGGDLPSVYRAIVQSPEAWVDGPVKFRSPWEWTIASIRAGGPSGMSNRLDANRFARLLRELGQMPWSPASPAGFADIAATWAGPDALIRRVEGAERLARLADPADALEIAQQIFPGSLGDHTKLAIERAESGRQALALLLASPDMMRR